MDTETQIIPGIPGKVSCFKLIKPQENVFKYNKDDTPEDIDIKRMARWAMNYLLRSPRPHLNYEPIFSCCPVGFPPVPEGHDPIVAGDTDSRMDWEFYYMRQISGATEGTRIEEAFHKRIRDYLGKNNICWTEPGCFLSDNIPADSMVGSLWATVKLLVSLSLSYRQTQNEDDKILARKVFEGLKTAAVREGNYAWYPAGFGPVDTNLEPIRVNWPAVAPLPIVEGLVTYWKTFGDDEALELAEACTRSLADNYPDLKLTSIDSDGVFHGHTHTTLHAMWGVVHLGVETSNPEYIRFGERIYKFMMEHGTGTGWMHESTSPSGRSNCSETCTTSDVMSIAACLAQSAGFMGDNFSNYYDHLERYFRNHIAPCQFFVTPRFESYYRERYKDKPKESVDKAIDDLRKMEGGILAGVGINDYFNIIPGDERTSFILVGCCAAEGIRAIYTTWSNIVSEFPATDSNLKTICVNMSLPYENESVRVISYLPDAGQITAIVKTSADYRLRPPAWTDKSMIRAWCNGKEINPVWIGSYIAFEDAVTGDELTISYPLAEYEQSVSIFDDESLEASYKWIGSTAVNVDPPGDLFPMHVGKKIIMPPAPILPE